VRGLRLPARREAGDSGHTISGVHDVIFQDRRDAGWRLGEAVAAAGLPDLNSAVVLGLARGGVPVAFEVARACRLPLDVMLVRKLGAPRCPEFAMGAIASGGTVVLTPGAAQSLGVSERQLEELIERKRQELERLEHVYREGRPPVEFGAGGVILVDDGLATGASMRAAVQAVRPQAKRVTVAVPVAARNICALLSQDVDRLICVSMPEPLEAVSLFYREFEPTSDDEVRGLLAEGRKRQGPRIRDQGSGTGTS
jgi:putative phosphoribosyl transferase